MGSAKKNHKISKIPKPPPPENISQNLHGIPAVRRESRGPTEAPPANRLTDKVRRRETEGTRNNGCAHLAPLCKGLFLVRVIIPNVEVVAIRKVDVKDARAIRPLRARRIIKNDLLHNREAGEGGLGAIAELSGGGVGGGGGHGERLSVKMPYGQYLYYTIPHGMQATIRKNFSTFQK